MPLLVPPSKMTVAELTERINFHLSTAGMFKQRGEPSMAKQFKELADNYADELDRRGSADR